MTILHCAPPATADAPYRQIAVRDLPDLVERFIAEGAPLGLDTETTGRDPWTHRLVSVQLGDARGVFVADLRHPTPDEERALETAVRLLFSGRVELMGHNIKFDLLFLAARCGLTPDTLKGLRLYDTMLAEQVILGGADALDGSGRERASLDATAARYGLSIPKEARSYFLGLDMRPQWQEPLPAEQLAYAARDVGRLPPIRQGQEALAEAHDLADTIALEMACAPAVIAMEIAGVAIDVAGWREALDAMRTEAETLEARIQAALFPAYCEHRARAQVEQTHALTAWQAGLDAATSAARTAHDALASDARPKWGDVRKATISRYRADHPRPPTPAPLPGKLNLHSPLQLREALSFAGVYLFSTDADTLESEAQEWPDHPALGWLCEWRGVSKLLDAFGETILSRVQPGGRLHPSWRQIGGEDRGVATGRMSCSAPNLQQLPGEKSSAQLRRHIVAAPGHVMIACDLSQIEPRILAERSGDVALLALFDGGADLYTAIAVQMGLLMAGASKEDAKATKLTGNGPSIRDAAKTLTLATMYGLGPRSLAAKLGCDEDAAKAHLDGFFAAFPGVKRYCQRIERETLVTGESRSIGGRRRVFRRSPPPQPHQFVTWDGFRAAQREYRITESRMRRQAVNHTIQGTGADILKLALVLAFRALPTGAHLIAAVHDELLIEAPVACADAAADILATAMEQAARAYLPTVALGDFTTVQGTSWQKA